MKIFLKPEFAHYSKDFLAQNLEVKVETLKSIYGEDYLEKIKNHPAFRIEETPAPTPKSK